MSNSPPYTEDRRVFAWLCHTVLREKLSKVSAASHPLAVLDQLEAESSSKAKAGLKMALNDVIEQSMDWPHDLVRDVDRGLENDGLPSISTLRYRYGNRLRKVLKRGRICDETEYYLLMGIAVDQTLELETSVRSGIDHLLEAYEGSPARAILP